MIKKITGAITKILKNEFNNIAVYSTDIEAGYILPCFFIKYNSIKTEKLSSKIDTLYINLDILYACENKEQNQNECFEMAEKLRNLLIDKYIKINDDLTFQIYEDSIDIEDDYISVLVDVEMYLIKDTEENLGYMENIILD